MEPDISLATSPAARLVARECFSTERRNSIELHVLNRIEHVGQVQGSVPASLLSQMSRCLGALLRGPRRALQEWLESLDRSWITPQHAISWSLVESVGTWSEELRWRKNHAEGSELFKNQDHQSEPLRRACSGAQKRGCRNRDLSPQPGAYHMVPFAAWEQCLFFFVFSPKIPLAAEHPELPHSAKYWLEHIYEQT